MRDYIETQSGRKVWLPGCEVDSIDIEDIAHALSFIPRFTGHLREHYSVAEHSIHVSNFCSKQHKLQGLLHDSTEAYLCDVATPFKSQMSEYQRLEDDLWNAITLKFNVPYELSQQVKEADRIMLMTERDKLKDNYSLWHEKYEDVERVRNWRPMRMCFGLRRATPSYIKGVFLERFYEYQSYVN